LEGLGWRFHRIWSTDWFRNPYKETERLRDAIKLPIAFHEQSDQVDHDDSSSPPFEIKKPKVIEREKNLAEAIRLAKPYNVSIGKLGMPSGLNVHETPQYIIKNAVVSILNMEGPLHVDEAMRRITEAAGY
jgi:hypothetical protein